MTDSQLAMLIDNVRKNLEQTIEIEKKLASIDQALRGYDGQPGVISQLETLRNDYFRFKRWVLMVFAFMVGSGVLTVSTLGVLGAFTSGG